MLDCFSQFQSLCSVLGTECQLASKNQTKNYQIWSLPLNASLWTAWGKIHICWYVWLCMYTFTCLTVYLPDIVCNPFDKCTEVHATMYSTHLYIFCTDAYYYVFIMATEKQICNLHCPSTNRWKSFASSCGMKQKRIVFSTDMLVYNHRFNAL